MKQHLIQMSIKPHKYHFRLITMALLGLVLSCRSHEKKPVAGNMQPNYMQEFLQGFRTHCTYSIFNTEAGPATGINLTVEIYRDSIQSPFPEIDSLVVNGKDIPFIIRSTNPLIIDGDYRKNLNQSAGTIKDPIIDDKNFVPAWIYLRYKGQILKIALGEFFYKSY